jgi:hypothetical protein
MKRVLWISIVLIILVGGAILFGLRNQAIEPIDKNDTMLKKYGLDGLATKDLVNKLDSITDEAEGLSASITGTMLTLYDNDEPYEFALPTDEFYLSFAPYVKTVHPCTIHNLISCRGEIMGEEFKVSIIQSDGTVIMDQKVRSLDTGFIGVWLPKDIEAELTVEYKGLSVRHTITTFDDSDTCLTTPLKLS